MLQNAYFLAKIGADTAENEQHFAEILPTDALGRSGRRGSCEEAGRPVQLSGMLEQGRIHQPRRPTGLGAEYTMFRDESDTHFSKILQIFGGLVLGCIKTKFCKKICVRQHFSSSTRFAYFCTAAISKF